MIRVIQRNVLGYFCKLSLASYHDDSRPMMKICSLQNRLSLPSSLFDVTSVEIENDSH